MQQTSLIRSSLLICIPKKITLANLGRILMNLLFYKRQNLIIKTFNEKIFRIYICQIQKTKKKI